MPPYCFTETKTYTISSIYSEQNPKIPEDYVMIDFRLPDIGDTFLTKIDKTAWKLHTPWGTEDARQGPRIILKKIEPPPKPRRWVVEEEHDAPKYHDNYGVLCFREGPQVTVRVLAETKESR